MLIVLGGHADGRYTQTKKASVVTNQLLFYCCQVEEISVNELMEFRVRHASRLSIDDQNLCYIGMVQAFEQDTFPDHARCSGYDCFDFHESGPNKLGSDR